MKKQVKHDKLINRDFILLWQGSAFSSFGAILYSIAIGYWVYEKTASTALMGIMSSITMFTMMVLGPMSGAITDRLSRRNVLVIADVIRGLVFLVIGYFAYHSRLSVPMVMAVAFVSGVCSAFFSPAAMSLFPDLLPADELVRGQSMASGTESLIRLIGSAISGTLIVALGVPFLIVINGVCYLLSALSECFITPIANQKEHTDINAKVIFADIRAGALFTLSTPGFSALMICALMVNLLASGFVNLLIPYVLSRGLNMVQYGTVAAASSFGALGGMALVSAFKIKANHRFAIAMSGFIFSGVFNIIAIALGSYLGLIVFFFIGDLFNAVGNALINAAFILYTPPEKRGMITGFVTSASIGGSACSALLYGALGEIISLTTLGIIGQGLGMLAFLTLVRNRQARVIFNDTTAETTA